MVESEICRFSVGEEISLILQICISVSILNMIPIFKPSVRDAMQWTLCSSHEVATVPKFPTSS